MRIVMMTNFFKPTVSGVVTSITLFREGLIQSGHDVHIIAPQYEDFKDQDPYVFRMPSVELPSEQNLALAMPFKAPIEVAMRAIQPTLIHSHHPFWMGNLAASFADELDVPLVFTFHTRYDQYVQQYVPVMSDLASALTEQLVSQYLNRCTHIIAPTPSIRTFIRNKYGPRGDISVIPTPVDLSVYHNLNPQGVRDRLAIPDAAELLLYIGRLAGEKNLDLLLHVVAALADRRPQTRLLLVGSGPDEKRLKQEAIDLGLQERVIFAGAVPHSQVPQYAAAADLFLFPSLTDTQGLVLIEAMAAGTPVIAVDAPGSKDVLAAGGGLLVAPETHTFADAVLELLRQQQERQRLADDARQVAEQYGVPAVTARLLDVYAQLV